MSNKRNTREGDKLIKWFDTFICVETRLTIKWGKSLFLDKFSFTRSLMNEKILVILLSNRWLSARFRRHTLWQNEFPYSRNSLAHFPLFCCLHFDAHSTQCSYNHRGRISWNVTTKMENRSLSCAWLKQQARYTLLQLISYVRMRSMIRKTFY